ncbi:hypothetical protein C8F01DRAFT_1175969 [Mycena amicta]|nr:hypothetical protein C8F01DRAFT_1175969 [Mycena amicta]
MADRRLHSEQTLHEDSSTEHEENNSLLFPHSSGKEETDTIYSTFLRRSPSIIFSTLFYITLAVYAWVVTCILAHRPIGANHYGVDVLNSDNNGWGWIGPKAYHALYLNSAKHFRAARILQSVVSVLTIPLTSAVCTRAAVVFLQSGRRSERMSMRKAMALADESWTDLSVIASLFVGGWKRYGSSLIVFAIFLHALGAAISPLQEFFLTTKTTQTPTYPQLITNLVDIPDHFDPFEGSFDFGYVTALTRARLTSTTMTQPQMNLWSQAPDCNTLTQANNSLFCGLGGGQYSLANMTSLQDPFFSQLPVGFSTGLVKQFAPRINSTAHRENITAAAFPVNCDKIPDALFLRYANASNEGSYAVEICMPANVTASPWKSQRSRQDFGEELYLNITLFGFNGFQAYAGANKSFYSKITLDTTAGYFELPNYMNGGVNGPLIADDPSHYCDLSCEPQGPGLSGNDPIYDHNVTSRAISTGSPTDVAQELVNNPNKGPLLYVALALFGMGSFIDKAQSYETYFAAAKNSNATGLCLDAVPFMPLLDDFLGQEQVGNSVDPCIRYSEEPSDVQFAIADYLWSFVYNTWDRDGEQIQNAFTSAAFLANQVWLTSITDGKLWVTYDSGADTQVPVISSTAIIFLSVLLGVYLLSLLALATYGALSPHWTSQLDSFAMMRIGASLSDKLPLVVVKSALSVKVLDEIPGWIGDTSGGIGAVGELGVGADAPLLKNRRYRCLEADHDHRKDR